MEKINYTIYKLSDPVSNEIRYIGLTFNSLKMRLKSHLSEPGKSHKCNWIGKLKLSGLKPIIESIESNISSYEECCNREIYYIDYYKSIGCRLTNMASGGNKNKKMSEETKKKMSESHKERYKNYKLILSDETKEKLSISTKERMESPIEREKLRISNKRYEDSKTPEQKLNDILIQNNKFVYQYDKDMNLMNKFTSIREADRQTGISRTNISKCCKHKVNFVGGYVWRFEGDLEPPRYKNRKEVLQYDKDMILISEYDNIRKASLSTSININSIRMCCNGKRENSGGFIWKYKDIR